ncbi:MAG: hypothetical protein ACOCZC_03565 [Halodesulfurarchaeum sp.]
MNWSHSSRVALLAVLLAVVLAGPAAAISTSGQAPSDAEVGSTVDVTYTLEDSLYENYDEWTLAGETGLESVTWTVTTYGVGDDEIEQSSYTGESFTHPVSEPDGVARVEVRVQGTVPSWSNWSYDPAESLTVANFEETQDGGSSETILSSTTRPYTEESQAARTAIEEAQSTIEEAAGAGADVSEAENLLSNAESAYDGGNFGNSQDLAEEAGESAQSAQQSSQQMDTLLLIGGAIVLLAVIAGAGYWYLSNRETYDKLG